MKLFIERLLEMFAVIIGISLLVGAVILVAILPNAVLTGIKVIFMIVIAISILTVFGSFINWLIIEPFFTKKGVERD